MAKFLKNWENLKGKLKNEPELSEEETENIEVMQEVLSSISDMEKERKQPQETEDAGSEAVLPEYAGLTKEHAKEALEKRISEKLDSLTLRDLDELLILEEEREKERQAFQSSSQKRKKRQKSRNALEPAAPDAGSAELPEGPASDVSPLNREEAAEAHVQISQEPEPAEQEAADKGEEKAAPTEQEAQTPPGKEDNFIDRVYRVAGKGLQAVRSKLKAQLEKIYEKNPDKKVIREKKNRRAQLRFYLVRRKLRRREREAAARMGDLIENMDKRNEEIADKTVEIVVDGAKKFNLAREWADINKKKLLTHFAVVLLIILAIVTAYNRVTAYEYAYNDRVLGMVKNQEDVLKVVDLVSAQLTREHGAEINIDKEQDITFNRIFAVGKEIDDSEDVLRRLTYMQDMNAKGCGIYVDGKRVAIVDNEETAESILDLVQDTYLSADDATSYEEISFAESVEYKQIDTKLGRIMNPNDVYSKIMTGAVAKKSHMVQAGETFSGIARQYGISMSDLRTSNPAVTPERLNIGQEIILSQSVPMLTVQTVEVITAVREIPYETVYEDNGSLFKGEQSTKVKGVNGQEQVTSRVVKSNGAQVTELVLNRQILSEPTAAVVSVGIKDPPPTQGTGSFIYPVQGARLSSKFGARWGRTHYGIDLACKSGTKIVASDGGTVTFSGYSGSYGYVVKINHGGNLVTVYAHCSKLFVKKGEKVYQGQHIANVGNTGRSTGPHCHFEVQYKGVPKNPLNYL